MASDTDSKMTEWSRSPFDWTNGVVAIIGKNGLAVGTGFVFADARKIVTCRHVLHKAGWPDGSWGASFTVYFKATETRASALASRNDNFDLQDGDQFADLAILTPAKPLPAEIQALPLAKVNLRIKRAFSTWGFPEGDFQNPRKHTAGLRGSGELLDPLTDNRLQLRSQEVTYGFSGGPIWDDEVQAVVGVVFAGEKPDEIGRLGQTAFGIDISALRILIPDIELRRAGDRSHEIITAPAPPERFVGGQQIITSVTNMLADNIVVAIQGMGGIGKTALAKQLAKEIQESYPGGVFWGGLPEHEGDAVSIMRSWLRQCGTESMLQSEVELTALLQHELANRIIRYGRLLLIVDDVREEWISAIKSLLQARPNEAPLLMTLRDKALALSLDASVVELPALDLEDGLALLINHIGAGANEFPQNDLKAMLSVLGNLPLAIELTGKRIALNMQRPGFLLKQFKSQLSQSADRYLKLPGHTGLQGTFALTYDELSQREQMCFRWTGIWATNALKPQAMAALLQQPPDDVATDMGRLGELAMLQFGADNYMLHPVLKQYASELLESTGEIDFARQRHHDYCVHLVNNNTGWTDELLASSLPDLMQALGFARNARLRETLRLFGEELCINNEVLSKYGYHQAADTILEAMIDAEEDDTQRAQIIIQLGIHKTLTNRWQEGRQLLNNVLASGVIFKERSWLSDAHAYIGLAHNYASEYAEALASYHRALAIDREISNQFGIISNLSEIGTVLHKKGQYSEAETVYEEALGHLESFNDLSLRATLLQNIGYLYSDLGRHQEALASYEQALQINKDRDDLSAIAGVLGNTGIVHAKQGNYYKALDYYRQALAGHERVNDLLGQANSLGNVGLALVELGEYERAMAISRKALALHRQINDAVGEGRRMGDIGYAFMGQGKLQLAAENIERAVAIALAVEDRSAYGYHLDNFGVIATKLGDLALAQSRHREAVEIAQEVGDAELKALASWNLGLLVKNEDPEEGKRLLRVRVEYEDKIGHVDAAKHRAEMKTLFGV